MPVGVEEAIEGMSVQYSAASKSFGHPDLMNGKEKGVRQCPDNRHRAADDIQREGKRDDIRNCCGLLLVNAGVPY